MKADHASDDFLDRIRTRLGDRYEISRELFGGGMSRVFVAREIALDRQIVIKFLPPEIAAEANRDRFRREIQMAAKLNHPHIAPLFAAAEEGELLYYTMPYIAGESLRQSIESHRKFSIGETMDILLDVADALAYAHRAGIVHRDIKPANVLREGGHAVITDFGVAKALSTALGPSSGDRTTSAATTATGMSFGTPAYMAPEQIAGDTAADHRVDLYAFGLLGYELLTGKAPFQSPSPQAVMAAQLTQPPPPILEARPDCPPVLAALLTRCLEKDASRRPPSAESVLEVLRTVNAASGGTQFQGKQKPQSNASWLVGGGVLVASAVAIIFIAANSANKSKPPVPVAPPVVDSTVIRAQMAAASAESAVHALRVGDSTRRVSERSANKQDQQRLMSLLRDSIANAMQRAAAESLARVKAAELAQALHDDSVNKARRGPFTPPPITTRVFMSPEAVLERSRNMGPPRRIGLSIHSSIKNAQILVGAAVVRDSLAARLKPRSRYIIISNDSVSQALGQSRIIDSLRTWLKADMWATINVSGDVAADSMRWNVSLYDFTAVNPFKQQGQVSPKVSAANAQDPSVLTKLMESILRALDGMDRAPRMDAASDKR